MGEDAIPVHRGQAGARQAEVDSDLTSGLALAEGVSEGGTEACGAATLAKWGNGQAHLGTKTMTLGREAILIFLKVVFIEPDEGSQERKLAI